MNFDEQIMYRCLQLAKLGLGNVTPNPLVGAVLVYDWKIISEGYHQQFGEAHAEVNCINNLPTAFQHLLPESTLYVNLEPCSHFGKTPPCADLIIQRKIKRVVIGCTDINEKVAGKGIQKLSENNIEVEVGVLENESKELNKRFFMVHKNHRPYIILKWAQSHDGFIAGENFEQIKISNPQVDRLVHQWRTEEQAIMIGYHTALYDNPKLTARLVNGKNPARIVIDKQNRLPLSNHIFSQDANSIVFNLLENKVVENCTWIKLEEEKNLVPQILEQLNHLQISSIIVEGGTTLLQSFIDSNLWDEARVIINEKLELGKGIAVPALPSNLKPIESRKIEDNRLSYFGNQ